MSFCHETETPLTMAVCIFSEPGVDVLTYMCVYIYIIIYTHTHHYTTMMCKDVCIYISLYIHQSILVGFVSVRVEKHPQAESPVKISADAVSFGPVWPMSKIGSQY